MLTLAACLSVRVNVQRNENKKRRSSSRNDSRTNGTGIIMRRQMPIIFAFAVVILFFLHYLSPMSLHVMFNERKAGGKVK
jgi:hypothetical protein